ncbi:myosin-binding protein 1 isoform X2 [Tripterygium wilfordii]|uniref:myosin-binding protein 1 isoform X2 n=1 Tax=Tripterygium wilfordii TaxID=458696 RepID=UPI0018F84650|nr:myosin-binding protein 1 isoform X2 [Tripterygium wilfordii]
MAVKEMSCVKSQKSSKGIGTALASAVLEWLLIFMLVIVAVFSYSITKFAVYCHLQNPCLLCSRLDHALGNKKRKYYWDLICRNHKLEISSLVFCHLHENLADVHSMCENCLFSFATMNKSNAETYRLLVGKLGEDSKCGFDQNPPLDCCNPNHVNIRCSCCNEPLHLKGNSEQLMQIKSFGLRVPDRDMILSAVGQNQDAVDKRIEKPSASFRVTRKRNRGIDLSHIGYTELKITSDTESETVLSDDGGDDTSAQNCQTNPQEDLTVQSVDIKPCIITLPRDMTSEKPIDPFSAPEPSLVISEVQANVIKTDDMTNVTSTVSVGRGLVELDWEDFKGDPSSYSEIMPLEEIPPSTDTRETSAEAPKDSRTISLENVPPPMDAMETPIEVSKGVMRTGEVVESLMTGHAEVCEVRTDAISTTDTATETNPISSDSSQHLSGLLDLSDAYKLAVGGRGRQLSGMLTEQWIGKDSSRLSEDLKQLLSQMSSSRGFELSINDMSPRVPLSINDMSPRVSLNSDELRASNASGMQILQKRISLERNESGLESLDGSLVSEIEGESIVDRLKRQIEHDRKLLNAMYKELEEERNASAIAVNQAMAMITKLQEEKAALHMEALQNLRMMEEQAEYDMQALQKENDILSRKEEEIQDLEVKLAYYRNKYPDESPLENLLEPILTRDVRVDLEASFIEEEASSIVQ